MTLLRAFAPAPAGTLRKRRPQALAVEELRSASKASHRLGLKLGGRVHGSLSLALCFYPGRSDRSMLIDSAFWRTRPRWTPILAAFDASGVDIGFELHPSMRCLDGERSEQSGCGRAIMPRCAIINERPRHFIKQGLELRRFIDFLP